MQQRIGKYQVLEQIAAGGQGIVYRALDPDLQREIAIKVLHAHLSFDAQYQERFLREARMVASLNHPNVVTIHEVGTDGNLLFIAMEYLPSSLQGLLEERGTLPVEEAISLVRQAALGLQSANARGITHRDIKPPNLLLTDDGTVKVTDFGIARAGDFSMMTNSNIIMGTPHYMSPEQAQTNTVDIRSDIYSLGIVLYQMLSGELPFKGETPLEVMRKQVDEQPQPIRQERPDIPIELEQILNRCLEKSPARRYQTPQELVDALDGAHFQPASQPIHQGKSLAPVPVTVPR